MIAADTNVWARAYLNDDVQQARKARAAIEAACSDNGVFVPLIVLAELFWVLQCRWKRERVLNAIQHLLETDGVVVEASAHAASALEASRTGSAGFADILIARVSCAAGASEIITFDKAFGRTPGARRLN